jgi:predicted MFS family arabinose efflux permease
MKATIFSAGLKFAVPMILAMTGFSISNAQLASSLPSVIGGISCIFFSWLSDRLKLRSPFLVIPFAITGACFAGLLKLAIDDNLRDQRVLMLTLICCISFAAGPTIPAQSSWLSNNLASSTDRAAGIAVSMSFLAMGGLSGSFLFHADYISVNQYVWGFGWATGISFGGMVMTSALAFSYWYGNKKKEAMADKIAGYSQAELAAVGEHSPLVKYVL